MYGASGPAGTALKVSSPAWNGTDAHGFSALPGGHRTTAGSFIDVGTYGRWWTATENGGSNAYRRYMGTSNAYVSEYHFNKANGCSVRCVMMGATYAVTVIGGTASDSEFEEGATVSITAGTPPDGYEFSRWTTTNDDVAFVNDSSASTMFIMPSSAVTVVSAGTGASGKGDYTVGDTVNIYTSSKPGVLS